MTFRLLLDFTLRRGGGAFYAQIDTAGQSGGRVAAIDAPDRIQDGGGGHVVGGGGLVFLFSPASVTISRKLGRIFTICYF
jgi:hypothetical protein